MSNMPAFSLALHEWGAAIEAMPCLIKWCSASSCEPVDQDAGCPYSSKRNNKNFFSHRHSTSAWSVLQHLLCYSICWAGRSSSCGTVGFP